MTARELLDRHGDLLARAQAIQKDLAALKRKPGSANEEACQRRLARLSDELRKLKRRLTASQARLLHLMKQLEDPLLSQVLSLRYLKLLSHQQISEALHFSQRHIHRLQLRGIQEMDRVLQEP